MKVEQVTSVYKLEENGDLSYMRYLEGWNQTIDLPYDLRYANEIKIDYQVFSISETYQLIYDKLADIHRLLAKTDIDKKLYQTMSTQLALVTAEIMVKMEEK